MVNLVVSVRSCCCVTITRLNSDILLGLLTVGMAVLGGIVSALPPANWTQKVVCIGSFAVCGLCACVLVIKQAKHRSKSEAELNNEIARLAAQSTESISNVTGGDSFCWMAMNFQYGYPCPFFNHSGKYTLYEVTVRIVDLNKMQRKLARGERLTNSDDITIRVGEMHVNTAGFMEGRTVPFSDDSAQNFNIFFLARNGRWTEFLRLRKINDHWSSAVRVSWQHRVDASPVTQEPIFERIDDDYPKNPQGLVDWG